MYGWTENLYFFKMYLNVLEKMMVKLFLSNIVENFKYLWFSSIQK